MCYSLSKRTDQRTNHINKPVKRKSRTVFVKPLIDEIENFMADFCQENSLSLNPNEPTKFFHHFESNGWLVGGKTPMKNWKSSVIGWLQRNQTNKTNGGYSNGSNQKQSTRRSSADQQLAAAEETVRIYC